MVVESLDGSGSATSFGSGVVVKPGHVVTNWHVVQDGVTFVVEHLGKEWPALLIGVDYDHDLAELAVSGLEAPAVRVRPSSSLAVGEKIYAVGAPEHLELTISEGLVSGLRTMDKERIIQTSAAISPGSSGGGLFDTRANLVGITTFYLQEGQSLNFALPAEWALGLDKVPGSLTADKHGTSRTLQSLMWFELGFKEGATGRYTQAIVAFRNSIRLEPNFPEAHYNLAQMLLKIGERAGALVEIQETLRQSPDDTDALKTSALLFLGKKDYEGAATAYRKLIELQPDSFSYHTALGLVLEDQGNLELALREYRVALALNPSDHWTSEEYNSVLRKIDEHSDRR